MGCSMPPSLAPRTGKRAGPAAPRAVMPGLGRVSGHNGSVASGTSQKLSGLFSGGPAPSPWPSPSPSPGVFTASPLPGAARGNRLEARVWLSPLPRRAQPLPSAPGLTHTRPLSLPRPTWPPLPSAERQTVRVGRGLAAQLCGKRWACHPPTLDQLHRAPAPVGQRHHPSRARLQAPHPSDTALSLPTARPLPREQLSDREEPAGSANTRSQNQGPWSRGGAAACSSVYKALSTTAGQTRRTEQGRGACGGQRDTWGTRGGHVAAELPRATLLVAPQTHR